MGQHIEIALPYRLNNTSHSLRKNNDKRIRARPYRVRLPCIRHSSRGESFDLFIL
jgi:hypothetical protein